MHIAVFYQYYHNPDCAATGRHYTFIREWAKRHRVTVITTRMWYERRISDFHEWAPPGVDVQMLDIPYDNKMGVGQRMRAFRQYVNKSFWKGLFLDRPDVILGTSTPLTAAWVASRVAGLRRIPWVFEVRDLWPDFPIQMGQVPGKFAQNRLYAMEQRLYEKATHIVPLSPDMEKHILRREIPEEKVTMLVNGTDFGYLDGYRDADVLALKAELGIVGKKVVLYGGTLGRANDIPTLLLAVRHLEKRSDVRIVIVGEGHHEETVRAAARTHPNLILMPPQPRHRMLLWFKMADLTLVPFLDLPVLKANSPAKFFDSLGAGTPVLVTNAGWTKRFVEKYECGWYVPPSQSNPLAEKIAELTRQPDALAAAGERGATIARTLFDREVLAQRMEALLVAAAEQGKKS